MRCACCVRCGPLPLCIAGLGAVLCVCSHVCFVLPGLAWPALPGLPARPKCTSALPKSGIPPGTPLNRPYNKIKNWDYVKLVQAMHNEEGALYAVRVSGSGSLCARRQPLTLQLEQLPLPTRIRQTV